MNDGFYGWANFVGLLRATALRVLGKPGATAGAALAGGTTSGAPTSGEFDQGDVIVDQTTPALWVCTAGGTPGTWSSVGGGSGSVTSIDVAAPSPLSSSGGPITSSGTITLSWASGQTANRVLASPDGTTGAVSLRALAVGDVPSLPASQITTGQLQAARGGTGTDGSGAANGTLLIGNGSGYTLATLTAGSGVSISNSSGAISISATGSGGSVTSVGLSMPAEFSVASSPITTSGTIAVTKANQNANLLYGGPSSGSAAAPTFRSIVDADLGPAIAPGAKLAAAASCL